MLFLWKKKIILDNDSVVVTLRRFIFILYVTHSADGKNCYNFHSTEPPVFLETKKSWDTLYHSAYLAGSDGWNTG